MKPNPAIVALEGLFTIALMAFYIITTIIVFNNPNADDIEVAKQMHMSALTHGVTATLGVIALPTVGAYFLIDIAYYLGK